MAVQNVKSNYDTDIFLKLITSIEKISGLKYKKNSQIDIAFRVIADHVRAVSFSIADGQLPSNNGAGYVIRRILRRAIRYGYSFLDLNKPFIFLLVDELSKLTKNFSTSVKSANDKNISPIIAIMFLELSIIEPNGLIRLIRPMISFILLFEMMSCFIYIYNKRVFKKK